jgi:Ala-tRNA(Pro) deacylase
MSETKLCSYLQNLNIEYRRAEHPAVYTVAEARRLVPELPGLATKNLFLRDRRGTRHFLVVLPEDARADLSELASRLQTDKLSFASPERRAKYLGVVPGAVSVLSIINDSNHAVEVWLAPECRQAERLLCHPLVNTTTLSIAISDLVRFFASTRHVINVL